MTTTIASSATTESKVSKVIKSDQGIALSGDVVFANVAELLKEGDSFLKKYLSNNSNKKEDSSFVVDCKEMGRIDSAGIALLLEWQRQFTTLNKGCVFEGLSNQAQALIEAYRLQSLIKS